MLQSHLLQRSDSDLLQLAQEELADLIGLSGEPTLFRVVRWNHAMPQYRVGHRQRVARIENALGDASGHPRYGCRPPLGN
jgi:oxygen-dependent protoporphyrinogen oxidase